MKIAILSCFHPYRGGIAQFNTCLMDELAKEHTVKAFNFKRQYPDLLFPGRTQYVTPGDNIPESGSVRILDTVNPFSYCKTVSAIREWNPDILIVRYWMSFFAPSLGYVTRAVRKTCKVISILDNVIPHERRFFDTPLTKYFLSGSDGYVTLCDAVEKDLLKLKKNARHVVINHPLYSQFGVKPEREEACRALGLDPQRKTILFFGLIRDYKGLDVLLEAFGGLPEDCQLVVAGEPYGSFEKYAKIIGNLPGKERIHLFLNYISDDKVGTFFAAADVAVLPYKSATQSGISSVSYHFEVPVIVTGVGGLRETIGDRGTGLVAGECTPEAVRMEILRYFSDPGIRESCVRNIRLEKERLSWGAFCRRLLEFAETLPDKQRDEIQ